jgi:chromosome partitioning protein
MVITFCNGKGGAGKTTLSILFASALVDAGRKVAFLDRDPQQTASRWLRETLPFGISPFQPGLSSDALIIDTPPRLDCPLLHQSLREANKVILVSSPSPADLWTSQDTARVIREHYRKEKAALLFNQVQRCTLLARELEPLAARIGLPALKHQVTRRQSYQHAMLLGWRALDAPAREEILKTSLEIISF